VVSANQVLAPPDREHQQLRKLSKEKTEGSVPFPETTFRKSPEGKTNEIRKESGKAAGTEKLDNGFTIKASLEVQGVVGKEIM